MINGFQCNCQPGFEGRTCQINSDECIKHPCLNEGACVDLTPGYKCFCKPGLEGKNCETSKNLF